MKEIRTHKFFAAFIMTYERPLVLAETIRKIRQQSLPPELILVVDNSESGKDFKIPLDLEGPDLEVLQVGYNSGPAGAARRGLEAMYNRGYEWIYWGDDDNPPLNDFVFERFFEKINDCEKRNPDLGIFGGRGGKFNRLTGRIRTLSNAELAENKVIEVDSIPGGHTMLVSSKVIKKGVLPKEKLFFGFEEFDFCLEAKKKGFVALVNAEDWLMDNHEKGLKEINYRWKGSTFGHLDSLWRDYYSTRNLLQILYSHRHFFPFLFLLSKTCIKAIAGFIHGWRYGRKNLLVQIKAVTDFFRGNYGKLDSNTIKKILDKP